MANETEEKSSSTTEAHLPEGNAAVTTRESRPRQTYTFLYESFRKSGLGKFDSFFNALYITQSNKFCFKNIDTDNVGEGFFTHPAGYYKAGREKVRRAARTRTLRALEMFAKVVAPFTKSVERKNKVFNVFEDSSTLTLNRALVSFKKAVPALAVLTLSFFLVLTVFFDSEKETVIEVSVDGVKVGEVLSSDTVETALDRVNSKISSITGESFSFPHELSFKSKKTTKSECLDIDGMCDVLYSYTDSFITEAYGLYIDSELIAVLESREDIKSVLELVRSEHMKLTGEEEDIANKVEIRYQEYAKDDIIDKETLLSMFVIDSEEENEGVVALLSATDIATLSITAQSSEIEEKIASALLSAQHGDSAIELDFAVYYEESKRENIPYTTKYIEDDSFYENQQFVQRAGRDGLADNTYNVKYVNGEYDSRELISQNVIREPRECVVRVGTRKLPEKMTESENGGRYMINPVPTATISDHFGQRILNGRSDYHEGLDLAAWVGTPIYAAASGEVISAGYNATYGYVVKIRHDDGLISIYAHCSELLVSVGDKVSQADEIALVGSTGYSFGYHCHFEVIEDGVKVDPEKYIYSLD